MRDDMRRDLKTALKARDQVAVSVIRSALAAIDNAESIPVEQPAAGAAESADGAGSAVGLRASEAERRHLAAGDMQVIVVAEVNDRTIAATQYEQGGRDDAAERLRAESNVLRRYLSPEQ